MPTYTDTEKSNFIEIAQQVGIQEARKKLGYPAQRTAYNWARETSLTYSHIHKLTDLEETSRGTAAICAECGPVVIKGRGSIGKISCPNRTKTNRRFRAFRTSTFQSQGGRCAICADNLVDWGFVDHDHSCCNGPARTACGECFRGLLCQWCNSGLGFFKDSVTRLRLAAEYLEV